MADPNRMSSTILAGVAPVYAVRKVRASHRKLSQKSVDPGSLRRESLGTVPKLSYKSLMKKGLWAHICAPLHKKPGAADF